MSLVFLTGMMGVGKSYWATLWAAAYGWQRTDLDERIEQEAGTTIAALFARDGEAAFRELEHRVLKGAIAGAVPHTIIACGGGTPLFYNNLALMKTAGCVLYLQASAAELIRNLDRDAVPRPKLQGDRRERITQLLAERQPVYEQADYILPVKSLTAATFAQISDACTNRRS